MAAKKKARQLHPNNPNRQTPSLDEFQANLEDLIDTANKALDEVRQARAKVQTGTVADLKGDILQHLREADGWFEGARDEARELIKWLDGE